MPLGDFLSEDDAVSRTTLDVNVWGLIHGMRLVLPHMIERGRGHIVNVASMAGKMVDSRHGGIQRQQVRRRGIVRRGPRGVPRFGCQRDRPCCQAPCVPGSHRAYRSGGACRPWSPRPSRGRSSAASAGGRAEVTVPRYLAGWDLLNAATPDALMSLGRRVIRRPSRADIGRARRARRLREGDRSSRQGATMRREPRIVIIGAGVAGIATAVTLQRAGFTTSRFWRRAQTSAVSGIGTATRV